VTGLKKQRGNLRNGRPDRRARLASEAVATVGFWLRGMEHGKEAVDGSSPSEDFGKVPANRHFVVVCPLNTRTHSGHIYGTRDSPRRFAATPDTVPRLAIEHVSRRKPC
jgi:hypothetical protein